MEYNDIKNNTDLILTNFEGLDKNIKSIKKKLNIIDKNYRKLENNTILINDSSNSYLLFQMKILEIEHKYYKNLYDLMLNKYFLEIYNLSEYLISILLSLNKLEIENVEEKKNIISRIIKLKKIKNINYGKLSEVINITINNLKLINEFIKLIDIYIEKLNRKYKKGNIHNNNFILNVKHKKEKVVLEYNTYCGRFNKIIDYFLTSTNSIINQINTSKFLKFYLNDKPT